MADTMINHAPILDVPEGTPKPSFTNLRSSRPQAQNFDALDKRYWLQNIAQHLLPDERITACGKQTALGVSSPSIIRHEDGRSHYSGLMQCDSVWACPVCAARIGAQRAEELRGDIARWIQAGNSVYMLTFKLSHSKSESIDDVFSRLKGAQSRFKSGRAFQAIKTAIGLVGTVVNVEATYGAHGWHPHSHELWFIQDELSTAELHEIEKTIKRRWKDQVYAAGGHCTLKHGVDIRIADHEIYAYVAKCGSLPIDREGTAVEYELTHSHAKDARSGRSPFQLLSDAGNGDKQAAKLFIEYAKAMKGNVHLRYSRGLRGILSTLPELEYIDNADENQEHDEGEVFFTFTREDWQNVVRYQYRAFMLELASKNSVSQINSMLGYLRKKRLKEKQAGK